MDLLTVLTDEARKAAAAAGVEASASVRVRVGRAGPPHALFSGSVGWPREAVYAHDIGETPQEVTAKLLAALPSVPAGRVEELRAEADALGYDLTPKAGG